MKPSEIIKRNIKKLKPIYRIARKVKDILEINKYHKWYLAHQVLTTSELVDQSEDIFLHRPLISLIVPVYNPPLSFLCEMLNSVLAQSYSNWELCIADGGNCGEVKSLLISYMANDSRIKVIFLERNLHICGNSNKALELVSGDYIGLLDHDDLLAPQCLYEYVKVINANNHADFLYSDEDFYSNGKHLLAHFKPDFAPDSLRETNYITHFVVFRTLLLSKIGLPVFNPEFQGAQDYDLILRLTEQANLIIHIPHVLYHWRMHNGSSLGNPSSKNYAFENGRRALMSHLHRIGCKASVSPRPNMLGIYKIYYQLECNPLVSILIPNKDQLETLQKCIQSLLKNTDYTNFEIIIIENNSSDIRLFEYYKQIIKNDRIKVIYYSEKGFNYSKINNFGVLFARGEYLIFLNNDTEIINSDWLIELLQYAALPEVGAVGAKLLFPDDTIQHAGVVIGQGGLPGNLFDSHPHTNISQFARTHRVQNLSAVTGACLMVSKNKFTHVGGLEEQLAVSFNDVDLCLKLIKAGYRNIFNPDALLYHYESKSRGYEDSVEKKQRWSSEYEYFQAKWGKLYDDKYYPTVYNNYNYTWK